MLSPDEVWGMAIRQPPRSGRAAARSTVRPTPPVVHRRLPTLDRGEAVLLWICTDCGELGDVAAIPASCPACRADGTAIGFVVED
jgi:hypothetical protein